MREEEISADIVIIGAGIAGLSLAHRAGWNGLRSVVLDDGREGTTYAATGIIAPRADYMLRDIDLVRLSDRECRRFKVAFPDQIVPMRFLLPIDSARRRMFDNIKILLRQYDEITPNRRALIPESSFIPQEQLESEEPNIRKNAFDGALVLWELMADPRQILRELERLNRGFCRSYRRIEVDSARVDFKVAGGDEIVKVQAAKKNGSSLMIGAGTTPLTVVNAAGPWIQDVVVPFGINLDIELRLGIQASVSGNLFKSGVITFDGDGLYCVCLPRDGYTQVGPTNTPFCGHPDESSEYTEGYDNLLDGFRSLLDSNISIGKHNILRSGLRVKPRFGETNRPVIWSHRKEGFSNLYTLFPGKMSLGLLAADEMLRVINRDGWRKLDELGISLKCALEGEHVLRNELFLKAERIRSLAEIGISMIFN